MQKPYDNKRDSNMLKKNSYRYIKLITLLGGITPVYALSASPTILAVSDSVIVPEHYSNDLQQASETHGFNQTKNLFGGNGIESFTLCHRIESYATNKKANYLFFATNKSGHDLITSVKDLNNSTSLDAIPTYIKNNSGTTQPGISIPLEKLRNTPWEFHGPYLQYITKATGASAIRQILPIKLSSEIINQ